MQVSVCASSFSKFVTTEYAEYTQSKISVYSVCSVVVFYTFVHQSLYYELP